MMEDGLESPSTLVASSNRLIRLNELGVLNDDTVPSMAWKFGNASINGIFPVEDGLNITLQINPFSFWFMAALALPSFSSDFGSRLLSLISQGSKNPSIFYPAMLCSITCPFITLNFYTLPELAATYRLTNASSCA
jgi:hypothetical protein